MQLNPTFLVDMYRLSYDRRAAMDVRKVWGTPGREGYSFAEADDRSTSWRNGGHWWAE